MKVNKLIAFILGCMATVVFFVTIISVMAKTETCPAGGDWTKIDSDDLSTYPVDGVVEYCFKYGSPNSQGCEGGMSSVWPPNAEKPCGLSHWSYRMGEPTATPSATLAPTPTNKPEPTSTPIPPTPTPTPSAATAPTNTPENKGDGLSDGLSSDPDATKTPDVHPDTYKYPLGVK